MGVGAVAARILVRRVDGQDCNWSGRVFERVEDRFRGDLALASYGLRLLFHHLPSVKVRIQALRITPLALSILVPEITSRMLRRRNNNRYHDVAFGRNRTSASESVLRGGLSLGRRKGVVSLCSLN